MSIPRTISVTLAVSVLMAAFTLPAHAERHGEGHHRDFDRDRHENRVWHGDIRHFRSYDFPRWRSGNWFHGYHDGRLGWWWIVGTIWYFYPQPVYPYPDAYTPPVVIVPQGVPAVPQAAPGTPPQTQYWYYCESAKEYYPYVPSCPGGWKTVPATPADVPPR